MSEPVAFISRLRVRPGKLDALKVAWREAATAIEKDKPGTLVFLSFLDDAGERVSIIHVFGDAEAMDRHFVGIAQRGRVAFDYVEALGWEIYGQPSDAAVAELRGEAERAGVELTVNPELVSGFLRL